MRKEWKSEVKDLHEKLNIQKRQTLQDQKEDSEALNDMKLKFELLMKSYAATQEQKNLLQA